MDKRTDKWMDGRAVDHIICKGRFAPKTAGVTGHWSVLSNVHTYKHYVALDNQGVWSYRLLGDNPHYSLLDI